MENFCEKYYPIACTVDIVEVLKYIENDLGYDFKMTYSSADVINLICPDQLINPDTKHEDIVLSRTSISKKRNIVRCWTGCPFGVKNPVTLVEYVYGIKRTRAVKLVLDIGSIPYESSTSEITEEDKIRYLKNSYMETCNRNLEKGFSYIESGKEKLSIFDAKYKEAAAYILERGISKEVALKLKFGVGGVRNIKDTDVELKKKANILNEKNNEKLKGRITIPNTQNGNMLGMTGRSLNKEEKIFRFLNLGEVESIINLDNAIKYSTILLYEGAFNLASYIELTKRFNAGSLQGSKTFKPHFLKKLIEIKAKFNLDTEIVLCFDNDEAGRMVTMQAGLELLKHGFLVTVIEMPTKVINGKEFKVDLNDILVENGHEKALEIWNNLYKERVPFIEYLIDKDIKTIEDDSSMSPLVKSMKVARVIEKYLKWNISPLEREALEKFLISKGYIYTSPIFKYTKIKYNKILNSTSDVIYLFLENINKELVETLEENNMPYYTADITTDVSYTLTEGKKIIIFTDINHVLKAMKIAEKLEEDSADDKNKNIVKIALYDKEPSSKLEIISLIKKACNLKALRKYLETL